LSLPWKAITTNTNSIEELKTIRNESIEQISSDQKNVIFTLTNRAVIDLFSNPTTLSFNEQPKKFIVEYSSPNIAKPFHVGHLRSTIIGKFLSNLFEAVNHNVIEMNYLGDYGTQFGFLKAGIDMENLSDAEIQSNPLKNLLRVYVAANSSSDPAVAEKARKIFETMEFSEDEEIISQWLKIKEYTLDELKIIYERLNVVYDVYEFESMYRRKNIESVISLLRNKSILETETDGKIIVNVNDRRVPFLKSDSTTLYLTRDVAAVLSRMEKYEMDRIYYVVDNGQNDHFTAIKSVVNQLNMRDDLVNHIKFGRIRGMSTRKGKIVFLKDILDEAKDLMFKKQQESKTTKVDLSKCGESIADILGTSAIVVNDLKQRRQRDYEFDWNKILQVNGDTGIKFQYTHCRLFSLQQQNLDVEDAKELNLELLSEPEAHDLIFLILKYPEIIQNSYDELESCTLVKYTFDLCNSTSRALKSLSVKNSKSNEVASQRLLLFNTTRNVLRHSLDILGLKVLNEM
jgi:arginyl-tRNA synthetase